MWKRTKKWRPKTVTTPRRQFTVLPARSVFLLPVIPLFSALWPARLAGGTAAPAAKKLKPTDAYALIFGTVWGPDDHPVYGITVKIRRVPDKKPKWELFSDHSGEFAQRVPPGKPTMWSGSI